MKIRKAHGLTGRVREDRGLDLVEDLGKPGAGVQIVSLGQEDAVGQAVMQTGDAGFEQAGYFDGVRTDEQRPDDPEDCAGQ